MFKKALGIALLVMVYELLVMSCFAQEEKLTITTYYPSPYGSYNQLYVADKLGIGTTSPQTQLHIRGDGAYISLNDDVTAGGSPETAAFSIAADNGSGRLISDKNLDVYIDSDNNDADTRHFSIIKNQGWGGPLATTIFTVSESGNVGIGIGNAISDLTFGRNIDSSITTDTSDGSDNKALMLGGGGTGGSTRGGAIGVYGNEYPGHEGLVLLQAGNTSARGELMLTTTGGYVTIAYNGNVGIATSPPNSKLSIGTNGQSGREYLKIDMESGTPPASECNEQPEGGRMIYDDSGHVIWVCDGAGGWKKVGGQATNRPVYQCPNRGRSDCGGCPARDISFSSTCSYWDDSGCNTTRTAACTLIGYLVAP